MDIDEIQANQFELAWPVIRAVLATRDTWAYEATDLETARAQWTTPPCRTFVAREAGRVVGCYVLHPNHGGPGDHVANAGYMVAPDARGRGIGCRLCEHSLAVARAAGFRAMQFNSVVATNGPAVHLWEKHGFAVVGRVPQAFRHPVHGLTDLLIMHRFL